MEVHAGGSFQFVADQLSVVPVVVLGVRKGDIMVTQGGRAVL